MPLPKRRVVPPTEEAFWNRNNKQSSKRRLEKLAELYETDVRSIAALFNAHADFDQKENRPVNGRALVPSAEIEHLVSAGVIPKPARYSADLLIDWLLAEKRRTRRANLASAFIRGLSNGRFDYRSALGSYASFYALNGRNRKSLMRKGIEGLPDGDSEIELDFVYYAFRRFWKPYVFHDNAAYAAFDLSRFTKTTVAEPTTKEADAFARLLAAIRALPPTARLTELQKAGTGLIKGDKYDRIHSLEILGYCDILGGNEHKPIRKQFLNQQHRPMPEHFYARDWRFPACFWNGAAGLNEEAVAFWFPGFEA